LALSRTTGILVDVAAFDLGDRIRRVFGELDALRKSSVRVDRSSHTHAHAAPPRAPAAEQEEAK